MPRHDNITPYWVTKTGGSNWTSMKDGSTVPFTPPTPPSGNCLFGAYSVIETGDSDQAAAITRFNAAMGSSNPSTPGATGNVQANRAYDFAAWIPKLTTNIGLSGIGATPVIGSFESNGGHTWADIAAGVYDSDIDGLLAYVTAHRGAYKFYAVIGHEFNAKIHSGNYTFADYSPAALHYLDRIYVNGDTGIIPMTLWSGNGTSNVTSELNSYWPTLSAGGPVHGLKYGAFGIDLYQKGAGANHDETAEQAFDSYTQAIVNKVGSGLELHCPELGVNIGTPLATQAQTLAFIESCTYFNDAGYTSAEWFNSGSNRIDLLSDCMAAYAALL